MNILPIPDDTEAAVFLYTIADHCFAWLEQHGEDAIGRLTDEQNTLLAYVYLDSQMEEGGFIRLIAGGYGGRGPRRAACAAGKSKPQRAFSTPPPHSTPNTAPPSKKRRNTAPTTTPCANASPTLKKPTATITTPPKPISTPPPPTSAAIGTSFPSCPTELFRWHPCARLVRTAHAA